MNKYIVELGDTQIRVLQALGVQVNIFKESKPIAKNQSINKFNNGDSVTVYDRYRFAIALQAVVIKNSDSNDGVQVKLLTSNNRQYPVGLDIWVSEKQLRMNKQKEGSKPTIWQPPMGMYFFNTLHQTNDVWDKSLAKHGVHRNTKEACELASERMLKTNLTSAWAHEYGGEEEWKYNKEQYYVLQNNASEWHIGNARSHYNTGTVYMTKQCALAMCDAFNSGEFILP